MSRVRNLDKTMTPQEVSAEDHNNIVITTKKTNLHPFLEKCMEEESEIVEGIFRNYESPGGTHMFSCRKYPNQPVYHGNMVDGARYKVPLWVARWLNGIDIT